MLIASISNCCCSAAAITWADKASGEYEEGHIYFNGGCSFVSMDSLHGSETGIAWEPIAHYSVNSEVAMVLAKQGLGRVVLSGCHPEFDPKILKVSTAEFEKRCVHQWVLKSVNVECIEVNECCSVAVSECVEMNVLKTMSFAVSECVAENAFSNLSTAEFDLCVHALTDKTVRIPRN